jgi:hypothetical protein
MPYENEKQRPQATYKTIGTLGTLSRGEKNKIEFRLVEMTVGDKTYQQVQVLFQWLGRDGKWMFDKADRYKIFTFRANELEKIESFLGKAVTKPKEPEI